MNLEVSVDMVTELSLGGSVSPKLSGTGLDPWGQKHTWMSWRIKYVYNWCTLVLT